MTKTTVATKTTTAGSESHARRKRQACSAPLESTTNGCRETNGTYKVASQSDDSSVQENYSVWKCSSDTAYMTFGGEICALLEELAKLAV